MRNSSWNPGSGSCWGHCSLGNVREHGWCPESAAHVQGGGVHSRTMGSPRAIGRFPTLNMTTFRLVEGRWYRCWLATAMTSGAIFWRNGGWSSGAGVSFPGQMWTYYDILINLDLGSNSPEFRLVSLVIKTRLITSINVEFRSGFRPWLIDRLDVSKPTSGQGWGEPPVQILWEADGVWTNGRQCHKVDEPPIRWAAGLAHHTLSQQVSGEITQILSTN